MRIQLKPITDRFRGLERATDGSVGYDVRVDLTQPTVLHPYETRVIGTGFALNLQMPGFAALLLPRSGLAAKHGIVLANGVGLIDSDYRDEILVALRNTGEAPYTINPGDRIAQLLIVPVLTPAFEVVPEFNDPVGRGGGFGSTGVK
jgi:dUTP pyrophosphatase